MQNRTPAPNGRYFDRLSILFGASGAVSRPKVCANLEVLRPSKRQWKPRLRQVALTLYAILGQCVTQAECFRKACNNPKKIVILHLVTNNIIDNE